MALGHDKAQIDIYKTKLLTNATDQLKRWRQVGGSVAETSRPDRKKLISKKIDLLRASSSPNHPVCFRCTDRGHTAPQCRNAVLCFVCNRFGHRSHTCRAVTEYTLPLRPPQPNPPKLSNPKQQSSDLEMARVVHYRSTPASQGLEKAFYRSIFIEDKLQWGPRRVEAALYDLLPTGNWIVRVYDDFLYLVEAPTKEWFDAVMVQRVLFLENREFKIWPWDPSYDEGYLMVPVWVRLKHFPMRFWHFESFAKFFDEYGGVLLELDNNTAKHLDWRHARMKVALCDPRSLPPTGWLPI